MTARTTVFAPALPCVALQRSRRVCHGEIMRVGGSSVSIFFTRFYGCREHNTQALDFRWLTKLARRLLSIVMWAFRVLWLTFGPAAATQWLPAHSQSDADAAVALDAPYTSRLSSPTPVRFCAPACQAMQRRSARCIASYVRGVVTRWRYAARRHAVGRRELTFTRRQRAPKTPLRRHIPGPDQRLRPHSNGAR